MQKCYKRIEIMQEVNKISKGFLSKDDGPHSLIYRAPKMNDCYKHRILINIRLHV